MINETFAVLAAMTLAGSVAIVFVLIARGFLRRRLGAHVAYSTWIVVPLAAMATLLPAPQRPITAVLQASRSITGVVEMHQATVPIDWRPFLTMAWLAGVLATAIVLAVQQRRFLRSLGRLHTLKKGVVRSDCSDAGPALVGAWRPLIVLPADFDARYTPLERDLVLAHECLHRERGDARINAIVAALRCLNWFNPLVHHAASRFRFDQEISCDAAVLTRFPHERRSYADAMLKTQLAGQEREMLRLPVGCRWPSAHPLTERLLMLKHPATTRSQRAAGVAVVIAFGICGAVVAWASQSPVVVPVAGLPVIETNIVVKHRNPAGEDEASSLVDTSGQPISFAVEANSAEWTGEFRARPAGNATLEVDGTVRFAGAVVSQPSLVVRSGIPAMVEIMTPDGRGGIGLEITLTQHVPGWTSVVVAAGDRPANEDTTYRQSFPPSYPQAALDAHQSGHVVLKVLVDEQGWPRSAEVASANPPEVASVFGPESVRTVMQWHFNPARKEGKPVSGYILVPIDFSLDG